nr:MAG TPA: hypothetical protein [Caudoviricetes sp.]
MIFKRFLSVLILLWVFICYYIKNDLKRLIKQLGNWKTLLIFFIVCAIMSSEVWVMYILGWVLHNQWFIHIGNICWLWWAGPFTPFIPICVAITLFIQKILIRR